MHDARGPDELHCAAKPGVAADDAEHGRRELARDEVVEEPLSSLVRLAAACLEQQELLLAGQQDRATSTGELTTLPAGADP